MGISKVSDDVSLTGSTAPSTQPAKDYWFEIELLTEGVGLLTIDKNTGTLYANYGVNLVKSIDNGDNWTVVCSKYMSPPNSLGIMELMVTSTGTLLASVKNSPHTNGWLYRSDDNGANWSVVWTWNSASYILANGWCEHPDYDGADHAAIYVAEYTAVASDGLRLLRSIDDGATFSVIDTQLYLGEGIRHWHFVTYDEWDNCLWLGSGDEAVNCKVYKVTDGSTLTYVGGGTYDWKFVTVVPDKGVLYCMSDRTDVYTGVPVYRYFKRDATLSIMGYCGSCAWYGAIIDTYRIPFWITQANTTTSTNSYIQGYIWDGYVREVVRIPIIVGADTVHISQICSKDDYAFAHIGSTTLNTTNIAFIRFKVTPIREKDFGVV